MPNNQGEIILATHESEDVLIGSILIQSSDGDKNAINEVSKILLPEHFDSYFDRVIYTAMLSCPSAPHIVNTTKQLEITNHLENGMLLHLGYCVSRVPSSLDYMDYAKAIIHYASVRGGIITPNVKGALL